MKILFIDTETTGLSAKPGANELVQLGCMMTTGRTILESLDVTSRPNNWSSINTKALEVTHKTIDDLKQYTDPKISFDMFYPSAIFWAFFYLYLKSLSSSAPIIFS